MAICWASLLRVRVRTGYFQASTVLSHTDCRVTETASIYHAARCTLFQHGVRITRNLLSHCRRDALTTNTRVSQLRSHSQMQMGPFFNFFYVFHGCEKYRYMHRTSQQAHTQVVPPNSWLSIADFLFKIFCFRSNSSISDSGLRLKPESEI